MIARLVLVLFALMLFWPAQAQAQSCSMSVQPLSFGTMGTPTIQRDTTADISLSCSGSAGSTVRVCLAINAGSFPSFGTTRYMVNGFNWLPYQITTTPGGANWGDYVFTNGQQVNVTIGGNGNGTATATMYGRIAAGENLPAALYTSSLMVSGRIPSGGSPCTSSSGGTPVPSRTFIASANLGGTCTITASDVNFGTVASLATATTASGSLAVTCNPGMPYSIALNAGITTGNTIAARRMSLNGSGPGVVSYQLYQDAGYSTLWGDGTSGAIYPGTGAVITQTIPVHGRVPAQPTPAAGTYRDTITATITY